MANKRPTRKRRGRGEGSIFQRADGSWSAEVSLGYDGKGKRRRKTVYGQTKQEVQEELRKLQTDNAAGRLTEADRYTVAEFLTLWLETVARPKVSATTYTRYEQQVRLHLTAHLGTIRLSKLNAMHVGQLYVLMEKAGDSASERQRVGKCLSQALKLAVRRGLIPHNPATDVERPRVARAEITPLNQQQAGQFLEAAEQDRFYAMYVLALDSGMRQGELFGLQWPDFDFDTRSVQVQRSLEEVKGQLRLKETKTGKSRRRIDLSPFTLDALHEHRKRMLAEGHTSGAVFCDTEGKLLRKSNVYRRSFKATLKRANKKAVKEAEERAVKEGLAAAPPAKLLPDIRFHDLRHTCATLLLLADENVKVVSERLGHRGIEITLNTYSHVLPTMQKRAAEKMQGIFGSFGKASAG